MEAFKGREACERCGAVAEQEVAEVARETERKMACEGAMVLCVEPVLEGVEGDETAFCEVCEENMGACG